MRYRFNQERRILCVEDCFGIPTSDSPSIWLIPELPACLSEWSSFDMLGTLQNVDSLLEEPDAFSFPHHQDSNAKLDEAVEAIGLVLGYPQLTRDQGLALLGAETMEFLLMGAILFSLSEQSGIDPSATESLWLHSLRTASLAGYIANHEQAGRETVLHAYIGGVFHDIGLLVLAMLESDRYPYVIDRAQKQDRTLASVEEEVFDRSHPAVGASLLQKMELPHQVVEAVAYHDEPFRASGQEFSAVTGVYAANILDGGGWPQDGDGVPSIWGMEYLASHELADRWPIWRQYWMPCQKREQ